MSSKLIGVSHRESDLEEHLGHFDRIIGEKPSEVMLELPPEWEKYKEFMEGTYFFTLADIYKQRGSKIIPGDIGNEKRIKTLKFLVNFRKKLNDVDVQIGWRDLDDLLGVYLGSKVDHYLSIFKSRVKRARNEAIAQVIQKYQPEAIILGDGHADYLKRTFSELDYTRIITGHTQNLIARLLEWTGIAVQADHKIISI